jgi:tRNA (adenine22-N1)-methyltransferase
MRTLQQNNIPVLSPRLKAIAEQVSDGMVFADVGTDHAYIPIYLVNMEICKYGFASDIRKGPLDRAKQNIVKYGCNGGITSILTDGLKGLPLYDIDIIIIAGMGGETIINMLEEASGLLKIGTKLVIQPMTDLKEVRQYVYGHGFQIVSERLAGFCFITP